MGAAFTVLVTLVGVGAAVWGLWGYGSEDAAKDEVIGRLSITVVCSFALISQYFRWLVQIPAEIDSENRATIADLERRLSPKLRFVWRPYDNKFLEEKQLSRGKQMRIGKIGRIAIKNQSESQTISGVHVSLVNFRRALDESPVSIDRRLIGMNSNAHVSDLHAAREETYDVFRMYEGKDTLRLAPCDETEAPRTLPSGTYKLKLTASAAGMSRVDEYYFLRFDNYSVIEFRPWESSDVLAPGASG